MKLFIFFLIFLLLFSQFGNSFELNTNKENDIQDISPKIEDNFLSDSSYNQNYSEDKISSINNVEQIQTNETTNITSRPLVFSHLLENGEVWSNGTHNKAVITTQALNIYDSDNNTYTKYILKKIGSSYYLQSAYGLWRLDKETGVVLLNKNTNQTIYESEQWSLIYNGVERTETSKQIKLIEKNQENLTIEVSKSYSEGILNVSYHWIQGRLKINVLIKAYIAGNFRVGLKITGLDQFTTSDLINLNKSNFMLNFEDMESQIDYIHSSFISGILTLVSNVYALNINDIRELDPTSYETNDEDDFFLNKYSAGTYGIDITAADFYIGNRSVNNLARRSFLRFNLGFIGQYSVLSSTYLNLTINNPLDGILNMNVSALGWDIIQEPLTETNVQANASVFNDYYLNNGSNYNITIALDTITVDQSNDWNVTDFTQEWISGRTLDINNIGWQMRQIKDDTDQYCITFYDAQHATGQAPTLTITWVDDVIPPFISSNQSNDWVNMNAFNITTYDQPTSSTSGLNLSSLAYSLDYTNWLIVPDSSIVSISDNTTFPTYFIVNNLLSEGSSTISFRIADLNGNWGYSNSSFGKQYYPKFTGEYAFRNETEQLGWGEEWTDVLGSNSVVGALSYSFSLDTGIYGNAIKCEVEDNNQVNEVNIRKDIQDNIAEYSILIMDLKANKSITIDYLLISNGAQTSYLIASTDIQVTTSWSHLILDLSDMTSNNFNISLVDRIIFRVLADNYSLLFDGLHFENEDGDSITESVSGDNYEWEALSGIYFGNATTSTDSELGYESIKYELNSTAGTNPELIYTNYIDLSAYDTITFKVKSNITASSGFGYILISSVGGTSSPYLQKTFTGNDDNLSMSWVEYTILLANFTEVGDFNQSKVKNLFFRCNPINPIMLYLDALNFYKANNTVGFDETDPNIDSITVSEDLLNPWDHVCYNGSIIYYSNDQTMDSPLNLTVIGSDATSGFGTFNTSVEWNDGTNVSKSGLTGTVIFNYTISESESANNITITIYDQAGNSDSETVLTELDNTSPDAFIIEVELTTLYSSCGYITTTTSDSGAGLLYISVYLDTYRTNVSSGTNEFCNFPVGWSKIYTVAFDNVANSVLANNSGYVNILADYEVETTTVRDATQDPLSDAMVVLLDWYGGITIALGIILILFIVRRMIK